MLPLHTDFPLDKLDQNTSLHAMFTTQPPSRTFELYWQRKGEEDVRTLEVQAGFGKGEGVRVGDVVGALAGLEEREFRGMIAWVRVSGDLSRGGLVEGWRC